MECENASYQNILKRVICVSGLPGAFASLYVGDQKIGADFIGKFSLIYHQQDLTKLFPKSQILDINRFTDSNKE